MSKNFLIRNAQIVNEGKSFPGSVAVANGRIQKIFTKEQVIEPEYLSYQVIDASGKFLLPGVIDDQVHFREPGLTYKAEIASESKAAVAGGVTSFMEMPNTIPNTLTQELLEEKYAIGQQQSWTNYSFYMGASNDNLKEVVKTDPSKVCGIKVFMGSSTGNMLVDDQKTLEGIFAEAPCLVAVHCEHEPTVQHNHQAFLKQYPNGAPTRVHPEIRNAEACYKSSSQAVELASKYNTRLHVLHLSTAREMQLFRNDLPLTQKRITAEVCLHHLWFNDTAYDAKGNFIKWNPAIKSENDRQALWKALSDRRIDVVATDHAPHTFEEKSRPYFMAPSGGPMVQHLLTGMLKLAQQHAFSLEEVVQKMCHHPALAFQVQDRGFIREGYFADLVLVEEVAPYLVQKQDVYYKCGWTPLEGEQLQHKVTHTFVNGNLVYEQGQFHQQGRGMRLTFNR